MGPLPKHHGVEAGPSVGLEKPVVWQRWGASALPYPTPAQWLSLACPTAPGIRAQGVGRAVRRDGERDQAGQSALHYSQRTPQSPSAQHCHSRHRPRLPPWAEVTRQGPRSSPRHRRLGIPRTATLPTPTPFLVKNKSADPPAVRKPVPPAVLPESQARPVPPPREPPTGLTPPGPAPPQT